MKFGEIVGLAVRDGDASKRCAGRTASSRATRAGCSTRWAATACGSRRSSTISRTSSSRPISSCSRRNSKAAFYEPLVGAAAHALAAVLDRVQASDAARVGAARRRRAAGRDACRESRRQAASLGRVPRAAPRERTRRAEGARARGHRARLEREVAIELTELARRSSLRARCLPSCSISRSAIPSIAWHPVRLMGAHARARRERAAARWAPTATAAASRCSSSSAAVWVAGVSALVLAAAAHVAPWLAGSFMSSSSTACSRSAICCATSGASSARCRAAISTGARAAIGAPCRPRHRADGRRRLPARGDRKPEREPDRRLHEPALLVRAGGLPGLVLFKVVSTMDSMVGYKTPRYLRFGWCGARLDDVDELRAGAADLAADCAVAALHAAAVPGGKALRRRPRASTRCCRVRTPAGAKRPRPARSQRRLVGPIWMHGAPGHRHLDRRSRRSAGRDRATIVSRAIVARDGDGLIARRSLSALRLRSIRDHPSCASVVTDATRGNVLVALGAHDGPNREVRCKSGAVPPL